MFTALASLMLNRPVKHDLAMTGEITLRGLVLPIGGLKEKTLAAKRAGIRQVIVPKRNEKDLPEIPKEVRDTVKFHFVENIDQVLQIALGPAPQNPQTRAKDPRGNALSGYDAHPIGINGHFQKPTELVPWVSQREENEAPDMSDIFRRNQIGDYTVIEFITPSLMDPIVLETPPRRSTRSSTRKTNEKSSWTSKKSNTSPAKPSA